MKGHTSELCSSHLPGCGLLQLRLLLQQRLQLAAGAQQVVGAVHGAHLEHDVVQRYMGVTAHRCGHGGVSVTELGLRRGLKWGRCCGLGWASPGSPCKPVRQD